jgi:type II secretory pathway pseudopilin PulG
MSIILVLAGLILATSSYVHNKGARSRTEAEIAAMSAALENYKADNGSYPAETSLDPRTSADPTKYEAASLLLYKSLSGDTNADRQPESNATSYLGFKDSQLYPAQRTVQYIKDPFGNSYGYSTVGETGAGKGYNPTFDLWSTAGATNSTSQAGWIKNW